MAWNPATSQTRNSDYGSTAQSEYGKKNALNRDTESGKSTHTDSHFFGAEGYQNVNASSPGLFSKPSAKIAEHSCVGMSSGGLKKMSLELSPVEGRRLYVQRLEMVLNVLNQMCIGFVTIYMSWQCLRLGLAKTALHAWLVTIGFSFLMAEAIMCHYGNNVLTQGYRRSTKTTIHWMLQVLGGGCGIAGVLIKCIQKNFLLTSTHGKLGFAAFVLCVVSMASGLSALFSQRLRRLLNPLLNKTFHNLLGLATFAVALVAQFYGYQTGFFTHYAYYDLQVMMKCITLVSLVLTSIGPLLALYEKSCGIVRHFG